MLNAKLTFDMKQKTYKEKDNLRERGTKKFQERVVEEKEAEEEIKHYTLDEETEFDNDTAPTLQELIRRKHL